MSDAINIGAISASLEVNDKNLQPNIARAERAIGMLEGQLASLDKQLAANRIGQPEYAAQVAELTRHIADLSAKVLTANNALGPTASAVGALNARLTAGSDHAAAMSRGLMQLGYMADDIQYGFSAIVNNIGPMVLAFTGNSGLAAAAQVAAVAANQLYKNWDQVREAFGDDSAALEATRTIEGLASALKILQEDANNFSWGDALAMAFGFNSDAGKAAKAEGMADLLKHRKEAEAQAKSMERFHTEDEKTEAERFKQAIGEAGGIEAIARKMGTEDVSKGAGRFLDHKKTMGGAGRSQVDEYNDLLELSKKGPLSEKDASRKHDLEVIARQAAIQAARETIGAAAYGNEADREAIGARVGGGHGDVIAGRLPTQKQDKENAKEIQKQSDKAEHDRIANAAKADAAWEKDAQSEERMKREKEAAEKKFRRDAETKAKDEAPGIEKMAIDMTLRAKIAGNRDPSKDVAEAIKIKLADLKDEKGNAKFTAEEAKAAGEEVARDANRKANEKVEARALDPREDRGHEKERSTSQVYATSELAHRVQASVSDSPLQETRKQTGLQEQMVNHLAMLVRNQGNGPGVRD